MARESSPESDDELFNDIYGKAYTGPVRSTANNAAPAGDNNATKKPLSVVGHGSEEDDGLREPNAIPTDFTSRDARVWDAKAKATERNWHKRQQEEMICKLCGDPGHYTQGCPSTLGASKKTSDYFERVAARDPQVRALFPPKVISEIENETGCKITMNEKFLFVSAKEHPFLSKGSNRVHDMIQAAKEKFTNGSPRARSRSPSPRGRGLSPRGRDRSLSRRGPSPVGRGSSPKGRGPSPRSRDRSPRGRGLSPRRSYSPRRERSGSQRVHSPRNDRPRPYGERSFGDRAREDSFRFSRGSPHARDYPKYGGSSTQGRSRSPTRHPPYPSDAYNRQYGGQNRNYEASLPAHKVSGWDVGGQQRADPDPGWDQKVGYPRTLEELEMEFNRETVEMTRGRDQEVDEEIYKYREKIRELRENYTSKLSTLRNSHTNQWDDFLQHSISRQPPPHLQPPQGSYPPPNAYSDLTDLRNSSQYLSPSMPPMGGGGSQGLYPYSLDSANVYSAAPRPHDGYGNAYGRY
ncbi:Zinc knuckle (CCHC-type) family protein [Rhynchospora pubera]|uniref:Zinc knuckle (CCHC-type) family protein n=1 Tax=Rhynchospora pubera TaxID=906938 RepID=A0AAV8ET91_9POAL|nr:Zinc knuckle (CCHC-type) family protein [Rhynchospora pubera]